MGGGAVTKVEEGGGHGRRGCNDSGKMCDG